MVFWYVLILGPADENIDIWRRRFQSGTNISLTWSILPNIVTSIVLRPTDFALLKQNNQ